MRCPTCKTQTSSIRNQTKSGVCYESDQIFTHTYHAIWSAQSKTTSCSVRYMMNQRWFLSPTQLSIQGQWWSNRRTQCLQVWQCLALIGCCLKEKEENTVQYSQLQQFVIMVSFIWSEDTPQWYICLSTGYSTWKRQYPQRRNRGVELSGIISSNSSLTAWGHW